MVDLKHRKPARKRKEERRVMAAEFQLWRLYDADAGGPALSLKVRFQNQVELPDWRAGPDLATALELASAEGWEAYDREPGATPGEYAIIHLVRKQPADAAAR